MEKNTRQQDLIIRQSQISTAVNYFTLIGKKPTLVDLIKVSTMLEQFINKGYSKEMVELMEKVDEHVSTIGNEPIKPMVDNHNDIY